MRKNNAGFAEVLIFVGFLLAVVGIGLLVAMVLALCGAIPGRALFYGLGSAGSFVLHFILVSLGGQIRGGLR